MRLGPVFQRTLEGAANATAFALAARLNSGHGGAVWLESFRPKELSNFRIIGGYQRGRWCSISKLILQVRPAYQA